MQTKVYVEETHAAATITHNQEHLPQSAKNELPRSQNCGT